MYNLCATCNEIKNKENLNIFDDFCKKCKKTIRTDNPIFYQKEYQRIYREQNKEEVKEYQGRYRKNNLNLKKSEEKKLDDKDKSRSRIYICKVGASRLKIGATCIDSNRFYALEYRLNVIGVSFEPVYYFDCKNSDLITEIERDLRKIFCTQEVGININSFKNELTNFYNLDKIYYYVENKLKESGLRYSVVSFK